jgi:hypothetical protein
MNQCLVGKQSNDKTSHLVFLPELCVSDFYFFGKAKVNFKGSSFEDEDKLLHNVMRVLKDI